MSASPWKDLLPSTVDVCGVAYEVRSDYRAVLDICTALSDEELEEQEKALVVLYIFYLDFAEMPSEHYKDALAQCFRFINCGDDDQGEKSTKLVDWQQDFKLIVAPVNRVLGTEVRAVEHLHWWTFVAAYNEIGECLFSQVVRIRNQQAKGRTLDKSDREWYRHNKHLVDMKTACTPQENAALQAWIL